jgi:hypothetical protein
VSTFCRIRWLSFDRLSHRFFDCFSLLWTAAWMNVPCLGSLWTSAGGIRERLRKSQKIIGRNK